MLNELLAKAEEINDEEEIENIHSKLKDLIENIAESCATENKEAMMKAMSFSSDSLAGINPVKMWQVKKKMIPNIIQEPPTALRDNEGNMITDKKQIKQLLVKT